MKSTNHTRPALPALGVTAIICVGVMAIGTPTAAKADAPSRETIAETVAADATQIDMDLIAALISFHDLGIGDLPEVIPNGGLGGHDIRLISSVIDDRV